MNKKLAARLKQVTPEGGSFDVQFNTTSGAKPGQIGSTVIVTLLKAGEAGKGSIVDKRLTVSAIDESLAIAQENALDSALTLLGV
jgi:hypothetical protein